MKTGSDPEGPREIPPPLSPQTFIRKPRIEFFFFFFFLCQACLLELVGQRESKGHRLGNCLLPPASRYLGRYGRGLHADVVHFQFVCCVPAPADRGSCNNSGSRCSGKMAQADTGRGGGEVGHLRGSCVACSVQANGAPLYIPDFLLPRRPRRT